MCSKICWVNNKRMDLCNLVIFYIVDIYLQRVIELPLDINPAESLLAYLKMDSESCIDFLQVTYNVYAAWNKQECFERSVCGINLHWYLHLISYLITCIICIIAIMEQVTGHSMTPMKEKGIHFLVTLVSSILDMIVLLKCIIDPIFVLKSYCIFAKHNLYNNQGNV